MQYSLINLILFFRGMLRTVLLPFHSTPPEFRLSGEQRDAVDEKLTLAQEDAGKAAGIIIRLGEELINDIPLQKTSISRVRSLIPEASARVHRSYGWLFAATLKVINDA